MTEFEKKAEELAYKWWHSADKEFVDVIDAYVQGYKNAIDNACEWLYKRQQVDLVVPNIEKFINDFKKAMEDKQ